jgi:hypothetical protein
LFLFLLLRLLNGKLLKPQENGFENWKSKLPQEIPVWDFSGHNTITLEPIQDVMENYVDNFHYTKLVGDLILNRILSYKDNEVPADFSVLVTKENLEFHLAKIRADKRYTQMN